MTYKTLAEHNVTGITDLFTYTSEIWAGFIPMVLFAIFTILMLSSYFSQRRLTGRGNFWASFAVAGYATAVITIILSMVGGLVNLLTLAVVIVVAVIGTLMLLLSVRD